MPTFIGRDFILLVIGTGYEPAFLVWASQTYR